MQSGLLNIFTTQELINKFDTNATKTNNIEMNRMKFLPSIQPEFLQEDIEIDVDSVKKVLNIKNTDKRFPKFDLTELDRFFTWRINIRNYHYTGDKDETEVYADKLVYCTKQMFSENGIELDKDE